MRLIALWVVVCAGAAAQERYPVDWGKLEPEIVERFRELIRIDTSNPPGNETKAAKAIQAMLESEGIATRQFALDPARANLVARLKGSGAKRTSRYHARSGSSSAAWSRRPRAKTRSGTSSCRSPRISRAMKVWEACGNVPST